MMRLPDASSYFPCILPGPPVLPFSKLLKKATTCNLLFPFPAFPPCPSYEGKNDVTTHMHTRASASHTRAAPPSLSISPRVALRMFRATLETKHNHQEVNLQRKPAKKTVIARDSSPFIVWGSSCTFRADYANNSYLVLLLCPFFVC